MAVAYTPEVVFGRSPTTPVLIELLAGAGLQVRDEGAWREFAHRVDQAITRDLAVAVRPC